MSTLALGMASTFPLLLVKICRQLLVWVPSVVSGDRETSFGGDRAHHSYMSDCNTCFCVDCRENLHKHQRLKLK